MAAKDTENSNDKKIIKISLSHLVKIETTLASFSESFQITMQENKKLQDNANESLEILTKIREKNGLCAEDGY